jgi:hypothetical protein
MPSSRRNCSLLRRWIRILYHRGLFPCSYCSRIIYCQETIMRDASINCPEPHVFNYVFLKPPLLFWHGGEKKNNLSCVKRPSAVVEPF